MARRRRQQILAARPARRRAQGPRRPNVRRGPIRPVRRGRGGGADVAGLGSRGRRPVKQGFGRSPKPWDSAAEQAMGDLAYENQVGQMDRDAAWQARQEEYGLGAGAQSPYSHAAMLKKQRQAGERGVRNTAGVNLYSGSTVNQQAQVTSAYDQQRHELEKAFAGDQEAYHRAASDANRDYELGRNRIQEGALERALESEPAPLGVPPGRRARVGPRRQPVRGRRAAQQMRAAAAFRRGARPRRVRRR